MQSVALFHLPVFFLSRLPNSLGRLNYVNVWHDNSGSSPSWNLRQIVIRHVPTNKKSYFICNRWLAVEKDDGLIERAIFVADQKQMTGFQNLFYNRASKDIGSNWKLATFTIFWLIVRLRSKHFHLSSSMEFLCLFWLSQSNVRAKARSKTPELSTQTTELSHNWIYVVWLVDWLYDWPLPNDCLMNRLIVNWSTGWYICFLSGRPMRPPIYNGTELNWAECNLVLNQAPAFKVIRAHSEN